MDTSDLLSLEPYLTCHVEGKSPSVSGSVRMNAYSLDGLIVVALLLICSCAYLKRIPRINQLLLSEKKGFFGVFYKAAVVGIRLHHLVSIACLSTAFYTLFLR